MFWNRLAVCYENRIELGPEGVRRCAWEAKLIPLSCSGFELWSLEVLSNFWTQSEEVLKVIRFEQKVGNVTAPSKAFSFSNFPSVAPNSNTISNTTIFLF